MELASVNWFSLPTITGIELKMRQFPERGNFLASIKHLISSGDSSSAIFVFSLIFTSRTTLCGTFMIDWWARHGMLAAQFLPDGFRLGKVVVDAIIAMSSK